MVNFLHNNLPDPIAINLGSINIYWYGLLFVLAIVLALVIAIKLAKLYQIDKGLIIDLGFWLIIFGVIGARIYHIGLEYQYYCGHPLDIFKIWNGGLAIHGGIIAGVIVIYYFAKKQKLNFWLLASLITPGLALAQAIGRWGNYFNQELYGQATKVAWGIPILGQPGWYHPTFLYESLGNLIIAVILYLSHYWLGKAKAKYIVLSYLILYSILRFSMEFLRLDSTPALLGWRWPQVISIVIILASIIYLIYDSLNKKKI